MRAKPRRSIFAALAVGSLVAVGCGPKEVTPTVDCSAVTVPRYSELTIWRGCVGCHASTATGGARHNAPSGVNFDSVVAATASAAKAAAAVNGGLMPPANEAQPTEDQKLALYAWALCGTPN